jgi:hypothetical protein
MKSLRMRNLRERRSAITEPAAKGSWLPGQYPLLS